MEKVSGLKPKRDSYAEMILRLAIAVEYKDDETGKHIIRVSDYSTAIAKSLNLSPKRAEIIRFASIMHDIGKIGVPDDILHKKSFAEKDYSIMKKHTIIGSRIFTGSASPLLKASAEVALSHHEWYDGTGYPLGLRGNKIPLVGRIVALADLFDAIVSKRSYKEPNSVDKAIGLIKKRKGTQFDPKIVDAFLKAMPSIRQIFRANKTIEDFLKENRNLLKKRMKD